MRPALDTIDLITALMHDPKFIGVFAIDMLPKRVPVRKHVKLVINLQPSNLRGSHWVAINRSSNGTGEYFDSYGRIPPHDIQRWLAKNTKNWTYNTTVTQSPFDINACGYLCIEFLK
jgi:hypothetical protein